MTLAAAARPGRAGWSSPPPVPVLRPAVRCARQVLLRLAHHQLHVQRGAVGAQVELPDGRLFTVFRSTSSSAPDGGDEPVELVVRFHLRGVPAGSRVRRWLFERESIANTLLFAGFAGYRTKLWLVEPATNDYAGWYTWQGRDEAERYAAYITSLLRPLAVAGSLDAEVLEPA